MEQRTVSVETLKHLEKILRIAEKDSGLRIENGVEKAGSKPGDNYMSYVIRIKLTGIRGNKTPFEINVITKHLPGDGRNMDILRNRDFFTNEAHVYTKIVPAMGLESVAPKCYEANANGVVMEDLCVQGYIMNERRDLLDFEHCQATVKAHARIHARSLMFKLKNPQEFKVLVDQLKEVGFPQDDDPALGQTISSGVSAAIESLKSIENPDEKIREAIEFLNNEKSGAYDTIRNLIVRRDEKYDVLTHGDSWNNNIFFKHDDKGGIANVKFVDFQVVRHCSAAIDFHYFVYTSAHSSVIEERYDELVRIYQGALVKELKSLNASDQVLRDLSLEWFQGELRKTSMYGLFTGLWLINAIFAEDTDIPNIAAITPDYLAGRTKVPLSIRSNKVERAKCIAFHYCRTYRNF
ncbi:uncharacterized protein [Venturia canescens]|uniref:uncharacterized protein n=1 Tax=Venturia canescens TaxID=32260 RepID=UPI001C9D3F4C|nr:uncharacterized protein LOC122413578 [Venturia canescens]